MPGTLPPQVIQNYDNPQSRRPEILGIGIPFITIASIFFLLRVYVKTVMTKKWRLDDSELRRSFSISVLKFYQQRY